ncbi:MAG TPA: histidinol dehydrogenase [Solirubrobacteraceae bacterium]
MRVRRFDWTQAQAVADEIRDWVAETAPEVDVEPIAREVIEGGDAAVLALTERFDSPHNPPSRLRVEPSEVAAALESLDSEVREALELGAANVRAVAKAQVDDTPHKVELPQGQAVVLADIAVHSAGVYAPGGRAAYPSSVLMCCIPARVAGVERLALASPPGEDGRVHPVTLAACALSEVDEVYAMGGAQAVIALACGTESVEPVDVVVGPGNAWVQEAKRWVFGRVGIDGLAGPSELMLIVGHDTELEWAALDLCAQAEHGADSPLIAAGVEEHVLDNLAEAVTAAAQRPSVADAPLALVQLPDLSDAVALANAYAPEHLQLMSEDAYALAGQVRTAGCVFVGRASGTAFGDYAAGSNHVLPTGGTGRFSGPLGPAAFRRRIANVSLPSSAAAVLAPYVDTLARAEGLPVHGESARARE